MKGKILVVDDEEGIRFTFRKFLSDDGCEVHTAEDFDKACKYMDKEDFDLIFTDIILTGRSGIDLLKEVKIRGLNCPVIIITGYPNIETAADAVRIGAFDYISKPVRKDVLLHITNMALQYKFLTDEKERYRVNLEAIFNNIKDAIISVDKELNILEFNKAAEEICGLTRNTIGKSFSFQQTRCNKECLEALARTIDKKEPVEIFRLECISGNRTGQIVSLSTTPLLSSQGIFNGVILVVRDETRLADLEEDLKERQQLHNIIGTSEEMQGIYSLIETLADVETTVLITGKSGTGKEMVAEALHYGGSRRNDPLVKVNCSALSENLLESELFGHVKGAFTGAIRDRIGRFQRADGGTIFLDEIAEISPAIQVKLLRVLQEMEFERVGDSTPIKVNVRLVAATNQDLSEKVKGGKFREDLYYRLKVMELNLPQLRDRREDIPLLVNHFLKKFNKKFNKEIAATSENVQKIFMNYPWPGNVRELEHTLEHAFILCRQPVITTDHLPSALKTFAGNSPFSIKEMKIDAPQLILQALKKTGWNKSKAARLLGISRRTLYRKIEEFRIKEKDK